MKKAMQFRVWGHRSPVQHMLSMHEALGQIPSTNKEPKAVQSGLDENSTKDHFKPGSELSCA